MNTELLQQAAAYVRRCWPQARPKCGVVCGSGWHAAMAGLTQRGALPYARIPGYGRTTVKGHGNQLRWVEHAGVEAFVFEGRRHWYEGAGWEPVALPIYILKKFAAGFVLLTNAAGGIRRTLKAGDLVVIEDQINAMGANPLTGAHDPFWGPRFPDLSRIYDARLSSLLKSAGRISGVTLKRGIYLGVAGPTYETPAEIRAFRRLGADMVGMSTVPEAILAHAAGIKVVGLSCISNPAADAHPQSLNHADVLTAIGRAQPRIRRLLSEFLKRVSEERSSRWAGDFRLCPDSMRLGLRRDKPRAGNGAKG
jgi:purine-nucleoside phosphorylase